MPYDSAFSARAAPGRALTLISHVNLGIATYNVKSDFDGWAGHSLRDDQCPDDAVLAGVRECVCTR